MNTLDSFFSWFLTATVRGSLLAAAVIAIGFAFRWRMPARWRYAMWLPVLFVLATSRLPQSRWSAESWLVSPVTGENRAASAGGEGLVNEQFVAPGVAGAQILPEPEKGIAWRCGAAEAWLAGVLGVLLFAVATFARTLRRMRRDAFPVDASVIEMLREAALTAGMRTPPELLVSPAVQSPAVCGLLRPAIL